MPDFFIVYDGEIMAHLAAHDVTIEDFQAIVNHPAELGASRTSGRPIAFGFAADGRFLACVYEPIDETTIIPVTAYEVEPLP